MRKLSIGLVAVTLVLAGCGGGGEKTDAAAADAGAAAADAGAPAAAAGGTGVAECDDYINKVMACINEKVPEAGRAAAQAGMDQVKKSWESIPDKGQLGAACKMAMDQAKSTYAAMGCTF